MNQNALATLDDDAAIAEIASGTLSKEIAKRYGCTPFAVRKRLAKHPDYPQAVIDQAESFVEDATLEAMRLSEGDDAVAIARARVKVDTAHKWAAARDPTRWAAKSHVTVDINVDLGDRLSRASERIIDVTPTDLASNSLIDDTST